jgi:hypothetical protein
MRSGTSQRLAALGLGVGLAACAGGPTSVLAPAPRGPTFTIVPKPVCLKGYDAPSVAAKLGQPALLEASGIVASPTHDGVLWIHNDSGDSARIFAVSTNGDALGEIALPDVDARDFEDIAAGPCPDLSGPCLYVADTGDNKLKRDALAVYAIAEPDVAPDRPLPEGATAAFVWRFPIVASPPANIEAFIVLPDAAAMVFYEKSETDARAFSYPAPWRPGELFTLQEAARFDPPGLDMPLGHLVTGADLHPSGTRLLLRTYSGVYEAKLDGVSPADVDALVFEEVFVGPLDEPQGEAVAYDARGTGIFTVSESPSGEPGQPLHHARCRE